MPKISKREKGIPKTTLEKSASNPIDGDPMIGWLQDLEKIFEKAMEEEKLNIALKAKELLARSKGWIGGGAASAPSVIKPINQWTLQEVNALIVQLDAYGDPDTESNSKG